MAEMLEFSTALDAEVDRPTERAKDITIRIDDREVTFKGPTGAQYAMMLTGIQGSTPEAVAAMINWFFHLLKKPEDKRLFKQRLWDEDDPFDEVIVAKVGRALVERWAGGKDGSSSSDSSPSVTRSGESSMAKQPSEGSIPSTSVPTDY